MLLKEKTISKKQNSVLKIDLVIKYITMELKMTIQKYKCMNINYTHDKSLFHLHEEYIILIERLFNRSI